MARGLGGHQARRGAQGDGCCLAFEVLVFSNAASRLHRIRGMKRWATKPGEMDHQPREMGYQSL